MTTSEQQRGIDQVTQAVTQMDSVTQQNAALAEESSAATLSLQREASHLEVAAQAFQV